MKRTALKRSVPAICILAAVLSFALIQNVQASTLRVSILHMNDLHGHVIPYTDKSSSVSGQVGGAAYFSAMILEERAKNPEATLLLSAGDMFQGTPISNVFHGKPVIEIMNYLQFDAMALGNHEFDWGRDALAELQASARFPFLAANIKEASGGYMAGTVPYVILEKKGLRIALIGVTTLETPFITKPSYVADLTFSDPVQVLPGIIGEARDKGAALVVILSHLGLGADKELAERVPGIDVIVGGHSHTVVTEPVVVGSTIIVQAGSYGGYLGVLELSYDTSLGKISGYSKEDELKPVLAGPTNAADCQAAAIAARYSDMIRDQYSKIVGESSVDLVRKPSEESNVGNLITDAIREATGAEIAFHNGGGIRADLPAGGITLDAVYTLLPFDNTIVSMDLTGSQILEILNRNVRTDRQILQVSGLRVVYGPAEQSGAAAVMAYVGEKPIEPDKVYRVAVNDYLASGGDGLQTLKEGRHLTYGDPLRDVFVAHLQKYSPVHPVTEGRIVFKR